MNDLYKKLYEFGDVKSNEMMSKHTTFKIGGPARFFVTVHTTESLVELLKFLDGAGQRYVILGGGSNMLVRDEGYDGVVIHVHSSEFRVQSGVIESDAGCLTATIARESVSHGLTNFEWAVGVPGTIGGAVRGNAGTKDGEMKDAVHEVDAYMNGEVVTLSNAECGFAYRHSIFKENGAVVLRVRLKLQPGNKQEGMKKLLEQIQYRTTTQPKGGASIGCIFKNYLISHSPNSPNKIPNLEIPEEFIQKGKIPAGWLVDKAGLKGTMVGGAEVSAVHGNFVLNGGSANAQDVLTLVEVVKKKVYDIFGVELEEEIQIV